MKNRSNIESVHNPRVKQWAQLLDRKGRNSQGKYLLEGLRLIEEAFRSGATIETVLYDMEQGVPPAIAGYATDGKYSENCEWIGVSAQVLKKCSEVQTSQGIIAIVRKSDLTLEDVMNKSVGLAVILDGVQDPGNVGTIIRSADAVGADAVILGSGTADLYNPKTIRATMGSLFHLPVIEADLTQLFKWMENNESSQMDGTARIGADNKESVADVDEQRERGMGGIGGIQWVATSLQATQSCYDIDFCQPTMLIFGNEGKGISEQTLSHVNQTVRIPMPGRAESLNVAMAATVLLFEAARQRALTNK